MTAGRADPPHENEPTTVLAVDDQEENLELVEAILVDEGFRVLTATSGPEALEVVEREGVETILLDLMMPGMDGFEVCRRLKSSRRSYFIPVVMVTAQTDLRSKIEGLECGADDYLNKPINAVELVTRLKSLGRIRRLRDELDSTESIFFSMISALEGKVPLTRDHSLRVAILAAATGRGLELPAAEQASLVWGALLHDLGKLGVSEEGLWKSDAARNADEEASFRGHAVCGERILRPLKSLSAVLPILRHHHERLDGSGFPDGISGEGFHPQIEIVAIAEAYEGYRRHAPAMPATWSARLRAEASKGRFHAELVERLLVAAAELPAELPEYADLLPFTPPPTSGRIFLADDSDSNREIMETLLTDAGYEVHAFADGQELLDEVEVREVDLVLVDVHMPRVGGEEVCRRLKSDPRFAFLPVILVTAQYGTFTKQTALEHGADEFLRLPLIRHELLARVRSLLRLHAYHMDLEEHESVVLSLSGALEAKDPYTNGHSARVGELSVALSLELDLDDLAASMMTAGFLHDIGKVAVPQSILHKAGLLTEEEMRVVKTHPVVGHEICKGLRCARRVLGCIRSHHERFDGSGYPDALRGEDIPLGARVLGLADAFDALTSERPYRRALSIRQTFEILAREMAEGKWDPRVFRGLETLRAQGRLRPHSTGVLDTSELRVVGR